jgi:hypothetical protein
VAVIIVGAVVLVEVDHSHHPLEGCVLSGERGLELRTDDQKSYALSGRPPISRLATRSGSMAAGSSTAKAVPAILSLSWKR